MGIDRIGKGGLPPAHGSQPPARGEGKTFEVPGPRQAAPVGSVEASPLEQLRSGKIDLDAYVHAKIDEATAHLQGLPPVELEKIRAMLRDQIASDPTLSELVKQATGHAPEPPRDE